MSKSTGFNIDDIVTTEREGGGGAPQEPQIEHLMVKLKKLKQAKQALEEEVKKAQIVKDTLQEELATLQTESYQLETILKEKEGSCKVLQFQCAEAEQDYARQLQLNKMSGELLEQYRCQIQEVKLRHRKQRMKFENQLTQLIEQHKNLYSSLERLPAEIETVERVKSQLLATEQVKLAQLRHLEEAVEELKNQKQSDEATGNTEER